MATATRTLDGKNTKMTITLTRTVNNKVVDLDGDRINAGREVYERYEVVITSKRNGQTLRTSGRPGDFAFFKVQGQFSGKYPAGTYARIGDAYIGKELYDEAMRMIAELDAEISKTDEQIALEQAEEIRKNAESAALEVAAAEYAERQAHPGWCNKCHSYCYGDCEA